MSAEIFAAQHRIFAQIAKGLLNSGGLVVISVSIGSSGGAFGLLWGD